MGALWLLGSATTNLQTHLRVADNLLSADTSCIVHQECFTVRCLKVHKVHDSLVGVYELVLM